MDRVAAPAFVTRESEMAEWSSNDFYVTPGLWGTGIGGRFLKMLMEELKKRNFKTAQVRLEPAGSAAAGATSGLRRLDEAAARKWRI
ncbi:MAG: GNAT family N-acetyltransferase [Verrucomicrobiota bacterium]